MGKTDIYGKIDHGNAQEITSEALSDLGKFSSNKINGTVKDERAATEAEDQEPE